MCCSSYPKELMCIVQWWRTSKCFQWVFLNVWVITLPCYIDVFLWGCLSDHQRETIICRHDDNLYLWCLCCCPLTFVPLNYTNKDWLPLHSHFLHGEMAINWVILWLAIKSKPMWGLSGRRCDFYKLKKLTLLHQFNSPTNTHFWAW